MTLLLRLVIVLFRHLISLLLENESRMRKIGVSPVLLDTLAMLLTFDIILFPQLLSQRVRRLTSFRNQIRQFSFQRCPRFLHLELDV